MVVIRTKKNAKAVQMHAERLVRLNCHKMHTVVLLGNARVRNKWINDSLLHVCAIIVDWWLV